MITKVTATDLVEFAGLVDGSLEFIQLEALDFVPHTKTLETLRLLASKLRNRGTLELDVTDFDLVCDEYKSGMGDPEARLCRGGLNAAIFNRGKICDMLNMSGFEIIGGANGSLGWADVNGRLCVRAEKRTRKQPDIPMVDIHAVLSLPRIAWTDTFGQIVEVLARLQTKFTKSTGVFWGQCIERMMEGIVNAGEFAPKYILTIDYDSIFDEKDVVRLWQIMEDNPDIAALCPMQIGRDRTEVLCNLVDDAGAPIRNATSKMFYAETVNIKNGHFGLTLIRTAALRNVSHPWFLGVPAENGTWGEGRTDEDIYFWHKLRENGLRVCATPKVRLGHLQLVVTWPKDDLSCVHQYLNKYYGEGRPAECQTY